MVFPVVMYGCESWTIRKTEHWRIDAFQLWCWRRLLKIPWTAKKSSQSILKEINPEYSLKGLMLKLKLQYLGHRCEELTHWKRSWCWERLRAGGEGDDRGWDGWMASLTQRTWVWANSESWWRTGRPGGLQSMGSQSDMTEQLNWRLFKNKLEITDAGFLQWGNSCPEKRLWLNIKIGDWMDIYAFTCLGQVCILYSWLTC